MSRFKVSKYRNALPVAAKKEFWIHDLNVGNDPRPHSSASLIKASCNNIAFINDFRNIGNVGLLPLNSYGRNTSFPQVGSHSGLVNDFEFSFYNDDVLLTGADDGLIKLWNVASDSHLSTLGPYGGPVELIKYNTQIDNLVAFSQKDSLSVLDLQNESTIYTNSQSQLQSICWSGCGSLIGAISKGDKGKCVHVYDPRQKNVVQETSYHSPLKGSCITWANNNQYITTGYDQSRGAEIALWSLSNNSVPIYTTHIGSGSGVPIVLFDEDTNMAYACLKGETSVTFYEIQDKNPFLSIGPSCYSSMEQIKGMCFVPKRALNVMSCEISRILLLTNNNIIPISYKVQRKNTTDFHIDLFPDTLGPLPATTISDWLTGDNKQRHRISLDPSKQPIILDTSKVVKKDKDIIKKDAVIIESVPPNTDPINNKQDNTTVQDKPNVVPKKQFNVVRPSKVRYIEGKILHKDLSVQSIPKLSNSLPSYANGFAANKDRFAFCLAGNGGLLGVYEIKNHGRMDMDKLVKIENGCGIVDYQFDPFDTNRIAIALDNAEIKIWDITANNTLSTPHILTGHYEKISTIAFHPQAKDILASLSYDMTIIIWDLSTYTSTITLGPLPEIGNSLSWSCNGQYIATLSKDNSIFIFDPRISNTPIKDGRGLADSRGEQLIWLDNDYILTTGFNSSKDQIVSLFNVNDLNKCLSVVEFGNNPAILMPHFDPDINVVFLSAKGERFILTVEFNISHDPYLFQAATFNCSSANQGVVFFQKSLCDVKEVEVEYGMILCTTSVELFKFTIPRVKKEYFQDDLYPPTIINWEHSMIASEWLNKQNKQQKTLNLCPSGMKKLSDAPQKVIAPKKYASFNPREKTDQEKKDELIAAMMDKMGTGVEEEEKVEVVDTAGVDSDEWSDD